ncbi:MAG: hypothetical protein P8M80_18430 [Pirellulaceae bacterium]|nr:hypothetical protein [Pirellulaceae bacterium]
MRSIRAVYQDPLELIWINAAQQMGIEVQRDSEVFAAWDGKGLLRIGTSETLDKDDHLAQMIFHEICHGLIEGPEAFCKPDWGLDMADPQHRVNEMAALRLQARLADQVGMREFFAATTEFRHYFDLIPADTLEPVSDNAAPKFDGLSMTCWDETQVLALAVVGWERAIDGPWKVPIATALGQTDQLRSIVAELASAGSLWKLG